VVYGASHRAGHLGENSPPRPYNIVRGVKSIFIECAIFPQISRRSLHGPQAITIFIAMPAGDRFLPAAQRGD
jgi:hypothetical protein